MAFLRTRQREQPMHVDEDVKSSGRCTLACEEIHTLSGNSMKADGVAV
jgi:hypothetical protein